MPFVSSSRSFPVYICFDLLQLYLRDITYHLTSCHDITALTTHTSSRGRRRVESSVKGRGDLFAQIAAMHGKLARRPAWSIGRRMVYERAPIFFVAGTEGTFTWDYFAGMAEDRETQGGEQENFFFFFFFSGRSQTEEREREMNMHVPATTEGQRTCTLAADSLNREIKYVP